MGRKRGSQEEGSACTSLGEGASAIQPPSRQEGYKDAGIFQTTLTMQCHVPPECQSGPHAGYTDK